jgi:LuxR family transcriptional regulator, positive regulator of biofilm formation
MNIVVHLANQLMAEAVCQLLLRMGNGTAITSGEPSAGGSSPDVLLVDIATLSHGLLARYPEAKVLLINTGMETEKLCATLLSYRIHGVLSPHTELPLLKKALKTVSEGQIWIDNGQVKALLQDTGAISRIGKSNGITDREQEIIQCICRGLGNREVAQSLGLSEHTVKSHLSSIFRKYNITSRSKLMALARQSPLARSA